MKNVLGDWYDYPQYYDIAFRSDTQAEANFLEAIARSYCDRMPTCLLEPACGSGRLVVEMASRGYQVEGFDLSTKALAYLRRKLRRRGLTAEVYEADMADFAARRPADLAFNFCNTFRHLTTRESARSHLRKVADSLRPGGVYVLGLHLMPPDADLYDTERWTETYRAIRVTVTIRVLESWPRRRLERLRATLRVETPTKAFRVRTDYEQRLYDVGEITRLLETVPQFELVDVYDFRYDIEDPQELDDEIADTVLILRKSR